MDQEIRNKLRNVVTKCRKLLEDDIREVLEGKYAIFAKKEKVTADLDAPVTHLSDEERSARKDILEHFAHIEARGFKPKDALDQLVREIAFTHLNRLCAYKMMEAREVYIGDQKFREAVSRGVNSNGVKFYLADHPEDERLYNTGHQDIAYRHFLDWLGGLLSEEIGVLFNSNDSANRLYPRQKTLDDVLDLLNEGGIKAEETALREQWPQIWSQDETIGWVYQYFTPKELREAARDTKRGGSAAPRNSYELAFRNQFFTPRYVVEFLTDNTLGRIWYEMRKGDTKLKDKCRYMVRRPAEVFLAEGESAPSPPAGEGRGEGANLSQEELLKLPVHIPHRAKKDPRELKILDPACGSGHFLLYCFDLLLTIYDEAYTDPDLGPALQKDFPTLDAFRREVPRLILAHNLHGIDIDLRASQIAALALWLRCQRAYQEMGLKKDRPKINRSNFVCAEPMPGEEQMLKEFVGQLEPKVLGQIVEVAFDKMKLAGEAGSLLKIEEEIRDAVASAKKQWVRETTHATDKKGRSLLFTEAEMDRLAGKQQQPSLFEVSDLTDNQFFEKAEANVIDTLRLYAEKAQNGHRLQRKLFTEDAVRGFAFMDLCQRRYDILLMNPPFGESSKTAKDTIDAKYPRAKIDLYAAFVERGLASLTSGGLLGTITPRTGFFLSSFEKWREDVLLRTARTTVFADLGYGVLDTAMVETAAYCIEARAGEVNTQFFRLLQVVEKDESLRQAIELTRRGHASAEYFIVNPNLFRQVPGSPFAYWVNNSVRSLFQRLPSFENGERMVRVGLQTSDDFRFLRVWWEVNSSSLLDARSGPDCIYELRSFQDWCKRRTFEGKRWIPFAKGGEYTPYYADLHLVVNWERDGEEMKEFARELKVRLSSPPGNGPLRDFPHYFRPGLTYPRRTNSCFGLRVLPAGAMFADKGPAIFGSFSDLPVILGVLFSQSYQKLIDIKMATGDETQSGTQSRSYEVGVVAQLPWPEIVNNERNAIAANVRSLVKTVKNLETDDELSHAYTGYVPTDSSLLSSANLRQRQKEALVATAIETAASIEQSVAMTLLDTSANVIPPTAGDARILITNPRKTQIAELSEYYNQSIHSTIRDELDQQGGNRQIAVNSFYVSRHIEILCQILKAHPQSIVEAAQDLSLLPDGTLVSVAIHQLSFGVGCLFGRWDIRIATGDRLCEESFDPFGPLPVCSPAMLQSNDGLPIVLPPSGYPLPIANDGLIPDDPNHPSDIVCGVRQVLELGWKGHAQTIEGEACAILSVKELRDYFRKSGKGGFWDDHISRYSKSRRKAPIYWLLQSKNKNYALWLYYHRLDKDMLFKALVNYVEPKIRLEMSKLDSLRSQKAAAGDSGKEAKRLAKEVERQEDLLSELRDFEDKLRRAADLHLEPDLNDGVVLNIAPLHELVPWKEAKKYWEELLEGKYEWSSIGQQLRNKKLVR